jgi:hypothetical protein
MDRQLEVIDYRRLSRKRIIEIAEGISWSYALLNGNVPTNYFTLNFDSVYDSYIYPTYRINLDENEDLDYHDGEKVLGCYDPEHNTIHLDPVLNDLDDLDHHRKGFTFWHELGHALLHGGWLRAHVGLIGTRLITTETSLSSDALAKMEHQANLFASRAAVPQWFLDFVMKSTFSLIRPIRYIGPSKYQLYPWGDCQQSYAETFQELCRIIAYPIRHRFGGLSIEAIANRVRESNWIDDVTGESKHRGTLPLYRTSPHAAGIFVSA